MRRLAMGSTSAAAATALLALTATGAAEARTNLVQVGPTDEAAVRCDGEFTNSRADVRVRQRNGKTTLWIRVRDARPDTLYTVWMFLAGPSPLTGRGFTALANPDDLVSLIETTPETTLIPPFVGAGDDGSGSTEAANAFRTNRHGDARVRFKLDYPLIKGAYQFGEADLSDLEGVDGEIPELGPVAIGVAPDRIFRIDSHCDDDRAHGVTNADGTAPVPSVGEAWWQLQENPFH